MSAKIYIVEDHPAMRQAYRSLLREEQDLDICGEAADAVEALREIPALQPDLVLVDISLPGMNGIELIRRISNMKMPLRMLAVTGHDAASYREGARRAGAYGYVVKGGEPADLLTEIRSALDVQGMRP